MTDTTDRFRKRPIPVTARQLNADSFRAILDALAPEQFAAGGENTDGTVFLEVRSLEGVMHASEGDWIVWDRHGHVWVVRGSVFAETYEPVPAEEAEAAPAVVPAADRAALVEAAAQAIRDSNGSPEALEWWRTHPQLIPAHVYAAAALSVLPAPADRPAVLRDFLWRLEQSAGDAAAEKFLDDNPELRHIAAESAAVDRVAAGCSQCGDTGACNGGPCPLRRVAAETPPADTGVELQVWPLQRVLTEVRCGSKDWPWEEEWADLARRHAETGYLDRLADQISENGITMPVLIGSDGRLWDGHHRLCIAVRLGIGYVPVELVGPAVEAQPGKDTETPGADA